MPKVTGPLFSLDATGPLAALGSFRSSPHGYQLFTPRPARVTRSPAQDRMRSMFVEAQAEWKLLDPGTRPLWHVFWSTWYAANAPSWGRGYSAAVAVWGDARLPRYAHSIPGTYALES